MTTITLPRAVVEQALEALEMSGCSAFKNLACRCSRECASYTAAKVLRAALAQEQAEPGKEPDSPERRCGGPGCDMTCCQPVQEPAAWASPNSLTWELYQSERVLKLTRARQEQYGFTEPLYTAPPQRTPLTEEEILKIGQSFSLGFTDRELVRAIERAHGIGGQDGR